MMNGLYRNGVIALLFMALVSGAFAVDVAYESDDTDYAIELNTGVTHLVSVIVEDLPDDDLNKIYVEYDSRTRDRVFCAPSPQDVSDDDVLFTCVITPGESFKGRITFVTEDVNGDLDRSTKLGFNITYREQWFTSKAVAKVGSTITVGGYPLTVKSASFLRANLTVDGEPFTALIGDETKLTEDLYITYRGYDPDTKEVLFIFQSKSPVSTAVQQKDYYLAVPRNEYFTEDNVVTIKAYTNCSAVEYRILGNNEWEEVEVRDGFAEIQVSDVVDRVYVRCADDTSISSNVYLHMPPVVEKELDDSELEGWCTSNNYILRRDCPNTDCASYCAANGWVRPPSGYECSFVKVGTDSEGDGSQLFFGVLLLVALIGVAYLIRTGRIKLPTRSSGRKFEELEKPVEEASDIK